MVAQQSVDDTLNEIKEGVEAASGEAEQPMELTPDNAADGEEKVDIAAFEATGEIKPAAEGGEAAVAPAGDDEAAVDDIDLDALMAEVQADDEGTPAAEAAPAEDVNAILDEAEGKVPATPAESAPAAKPASAPAAAEEPVYLNAIPSAKGLQVGFPMEILAEALRPLVSEWVVQNLPAITERLVREEIARLTNESDN